MIMTYAEETSSTFDSKTSTEQMNGHPMVNTENRQLGDRSNSVSSPSEDRHAARTPGSSVPEMGSTDSAGGAHSGPSCGLVSSLFPSSCRGRAEAFARRLHRRLTSLGGENSMEQEGMESVKPKDTFWLHTSSGTRTVTTNSPSLNHVLQHQPRHSPETDLYYDFDIELEEDGIGSPAEEATAAELADILVNPSSLKTNRPNNCESSPDDQRNVAPNQDPESGCVFASPITGSPPESDSSEIYFDPESSDIEKSKNEAFFDPASTSDSETATNFSCNRVEAKANRLLAAREVGNNWELSEDTSESCGSSRKGGYCSELNHQNDLVCSSEDSLNGRSSLETTSPSHESLWSTFDESTVSLQDDSPLRINSSIPTLQQRLPKSHSDSEIPINRSRTAVLCTLDTRDEETVEGMDEVDFVKGSSENGYLDKIVENVENSLQERSPDYLGKVVFLGKDGKHVSNEEQSSDASVCSTNCAISFKREETIISDTDTDKMMYSSAINIPGPLSLECPSSERVIHESLTNEVQLQIEDGVVINGDNDDKMCLLLQKLSTSPTNETSSSSPGELKETVDREEEEEEEERPPKVRRCSSLKTGKTPPGTPGRKKIVRFADVLGLDLADVRTFLDEIPKIPNSAYSDLIYDDIFQKDSSPVNSLSSTCGSKFFDSRRGSGTVMPRKLDRALAPLFQQPGGLLNFLDLVRERRVCLENVLVQDPISLCIQGTVRVLNLDFHKSVHIRYTLNSWRNFSDLQATYIPNSCDGFSDKFSFVLYCHTLQVGQRLEFAVRFQCKGVQYWDNNGGTNYCFQCLPTSAIGYIPITASENQQREWSPMFY